VAACYYLLRQRFVSAFLPCSLCSEEIIKSDKIFMIKNDKRVSFFKGGKSVMLKYGSSNSHLTHKEHGSREILKER